VVGDGEIGRVHGVWPRWQEWQWWPRVPSVAGVVGAAQGGGDGGRLRMGSDVLDWQAEAALMNFRRVFSSHPPHSPFEFRI
jgi:hypothetical protein